MAVNFPNQRSQPPIIQALQRFRGSFALLLIALAVLTIFLMVNFRVQRVSGTEVGIKVNNVTGDITVIAESGTNIYN